METKRVLLIAGGVLAAILLQIASARLHAEAQTASALSGQVTSAEEGPMEGVVVSAKKDGSTISISVVTNAAGRFAFPAARLEPGHYTLKARAAGYELDGACAADVASGQEAKADIKLKKVKNLSAHLTNAEWLISMPGTDEQKRFLLNCTGCHTLERIMKSTHDADGFMEVIQRMSLYYPGSTPLKPQRLVGTATRDVERGGNGRKTAEWLASVNLSEQSTWAFPLKTEPRLTGKSTHVIITEYDLPNPLIQPHDVVLDREGNVWYSDFGQMFLGKMDPKTGKVTQYPIPVVKPGWPEGTLDLEFDKDDNPWVGVMYQNAIAKFDKKTEKFQMWTTPKEWDTDGGQLGHLAIEGTPVDNKVWIKNSDVGNIYRLDLISNKMENLGNFKDPQTGKRIGTYGIHSDAAEQRLSARFFGRQYRQDRCQDEECDRLPDSDPGLPPAARSRRSRRPVVVWRISGRRHRHVRSQDRTHDRVEGANAVERAVRRRVGSQRRCVDRVDADGPCCPPQYQERPVHGIHAAAPHQHPPGLCRRFEEPRHALDRQQPRRIDCQGRTARLEFVRSDLRVWFWMPSTK